MSGASYVGIDLAWSARNRTGLAVVDDSGALVASGSVVSDEDLDAWIADRAPAARVVAVDAPLIVPNLTGQRVGETEVARAYSAYGAAPYSASRKFPYLDPPRAEVLAARHGWSTDPQHVASAAVPSCIEVYPHPALVGLFRLGERILYKKGRDRQAGFDLLMTCLESVPELALGRNERWRVLRSVVADPQRGQLTAIEDEIDAVVCAHLAWLWGNRPGELQVYGTHADGYIVAPPPPSHPPVRTTSARSRRPSQDVFVAGRPATFATAAEPAWRAAVRAAFAGRSLPADSRFEVVLEFVLDPSQTGPNAPDLDNLVKATLDALEAVVGVRPGRHDPPQVDDERIDRIVAEKRVAAAGETPGARIRVAVLA